MDYDGYVPHCQTIRKRKLQLMCNLRKYPNEPDDGQDLYCEGHVLSKNRCYTITVQVADQNSSSQVFSICPLQHFQCV